LAQKTTEALILERLDQILKVLAIRVGEDLSLTERVYLLKTAGIDNQTIADVLNTTPATVRSLAARTAKGVKSRSS
jgi:hypothetical protein